jgi:3-oxoacyl-[acyl-carrier-protein] synthase II
MERGPRGIDPTFILQVLGNLVPAYVSIRWGFKGTNLSTNSACATGAHAIGEAMRMIQFDQADIALAGGAEAPLAMMAIAGFNQIRALSTRNDEPQRASRPFDRDRDGFVMSEGAAVLLLEELDHARSRGARIYAELCGYGTSADAFHVTSPAPDHEGGQRCMRSALRDAGLQPRDIGYVNAHAASTPVGDPLEVAALRGVFGADTPAVPMSSTKSMTGHMMGAAGAIELAVTGLALQRGILPPTINLESPEIGGDVDYVPNVARPARIDATLSNSFGFGGTNACLVLRRADVS